MSSKATSGHSDGGRENRPRLERAGRVASPRWRTSTKRLVATALLVLALLALYRVRGLLGPIAMAIVLAYIVLPIVDFLQHRLHLSRGLALALIYLVVVAALVAIPVSTVPQLISQGNNLVNQTPSYLQQLGGFLSEPLTMGQFQIPLDELQLEQLYERLSDDLLGVAQAVGSQGLTIFGNLASRTLSTVAWIIVILVLSIYMVKDYRELWGSIVELAPTPYHGDIVRLGEEISATWNAFLRGQLILGATVGIIIFLLALVLGLPNALLLALLAGLLEFVPNIGPAMAAIPAVLLALFQSEASWLGTQVGPLWFAFIVLGLYGLVQQVENIILVPRIIGRSLNLHPLVVLIGALAGASTAGILGILLAAPLLASARLVLQYIYRKMLDQSPFAEPDELVDEGHTLVAKGIVGEMLVADIEAEHGE